jgi:FkbM family methyltransferase
MKAMPLAQFLLDGLTSTPSSRWRDKLYLPLVNRLRKLVIKFFSDPPVVYRQGRAELWLPLSHDLPLYKTSLPNYSTNIARIAAAVARKYPTLSVVDIGANVGDTLLLLREKTRCPVLCIDGDARFFPYLQRNSAALEGVELVQAFVGDRKGVIAATVTAKDGSSHIAEGSSGTAAIELRRLNDILDEHPQFAQTKLIKIDTDGYDCRILRSELGLLGRLRPVLLFEYDPYYLSRAGDDGFSIFEDLRSIGYRTFMFYENTGEYLLTADAADDRLLEDMHHFFSGWRGRRYCDICAIHEVDADIAAALRASERAFFRSARSQQ